MNSLKSLFLIYTISGVANLYATENSASLQRDPAKVDCSSTLKRCTYVAQNLSAQDLIAKLNSNLFPGSFLSPSEGYIVVDNFKKINFYLNNPELLQRFIALIPFVDVLEEFVPSSVVELTTEIIALTESASNEFQAKLTTATTTATASPVDSIVTDVIGAMTSGSGLGVQLGTNLLSSILGSRHIKEDSYKISKVTQLIPNLSPVSYSQVTTLYISPKNSGVVKEQEAGLKISGSVSISAKDSDIILIKDYALKYGISAPVSVDGDERINLLSVSNPQLTLVKGTSSIIISSTSTEEVSKKGYGALSFDKNKSKIHNQIVIVTSGRAISFKDLILDLKKTRNLELFAKFTKEEKDQFPNDELSLEEVLSNVKPYSYYTASGDRVLGFKLDAKDARISNIDKSIEVTVKTGLFKKGVSPTYKVQNLMLSGFKLESLSTKDLDKSIVKLKVNFKVFNQNISVNKVLNYNPLTNEFFEE